MATKSEPKLTEVTISHTGNGSVDIKSYGKEKSGYGVFISKKYAFGEDWTVDEVEAYVEERRQELRETVDALATAEHNERFDQSYMAGD